MANPENVAADLTKLEMDSAQAAKDEALALADQTILAADTEALINQEGNISVFTADSPPAGIVGTPYSYQFLASNSPVFGISSGTVPPGLTLSNTGLLSGTPTTVGTSTFVVKATVGALTTRTGSLSVTIAGSNVPPPILPSITSLSLTSAFAGQNVTITGTGFGATQGTSYVQFSDSGVFWGAPTNAATFVIDSWSDTSIVFTVPVPSGTWSVTPGTNASVFVNTSAGKSSSMTLAIITNPATVVPPKEVSPPVITGIPEVGNDLTTSNGVWD